jgi:hypothetical protein
VIYTEVQLLKNINNTDVAIEVLSSRYMSVGRRWHLCVRWWNIGHAHPPWPMGVVENIIISRSDRLLRWRPYKWRPVDMGRISRVLRSQLSHGGDV